MQRVDADAVPWASGASRVCTVLRVGRGYRAVGVVVVLALPPMLERERERGDDDDDDDEKEQETHTHH